MVFQGIMSRNWLSKLKKCASDGTFHPRRRPKRGEKGWLERGQNRHFQNIINIFDIKTQYEKGDTMGIKRAFSTLCGVKQQEDKQDGKYTFYTNIQQLANTTQLHPE